MNTDMNQYLTFWYTSTVVRKMTAYLLCCSGLACLPFVLTEHICSWRASKASETLSGVYKFELVRYVYIYIYIYMFGGTYVVIAGHATYA